MFFRVFFHFAVEKEILISFQISKRESVNNINVFVENYTEIFTCFIENYTTDETFYQYTVSFPIFRKQMIHLYNKCSLKLNYVPQFTEFLETFPAIIVLCPLLNIFIFLLHQDCKCQS